jgi:hypothetical protein
LIQTKKWGCIDIFRLTYIYINYILYRN